MNTISNQTFREKYYSTALGEILRRALIVEDICEVDRSDIKLIKNPYGSQPTAEVQAISGQYVTDDFVTTDDTLIVTDEVIVSEHIYDFEEVLTNFNMFQNRTNEMMFAVAERIDRYVLNNLTENAGESYTTPLGGFSDPINTQHIIGQLLGKVMGYKNAYQGYFLVLESTEVGGVFENQTGSGFSFADSALRNGLARSMAGIEIYITRPGTFADETLGTTTYMNAGHRVFGVKKVSTYASPRGIRWEEKSVSGKTGKEVVCFGYVGFKLWTVKAPLVVDITLA
jgi:hypothetical protein